MIATTAAAARLPAISLALSGTAVMLSTHRASQGWVSRVVATINRIERRLVITEPKTARSRRVVPLSEPMVALLRRRRTEQLAERLRAGDQWTDTGLVFTTALGTAVDPRNVLRVVEKAAQITDLEGGVGVHTLRHSVAVDWMETGTNIKAVADLLGHSSISVTGDIYGHTSDSVARAAVEGRSARLGF